MAFTIDGTKPKYINVNGVKCKKVTVNGTKAWSAEKVLANSKKLSWNGPFVAGTNYKTLDSSVKWDCRGYDTLTFDLEYLLYCIGAVSMLLNARICDADGEIIAYAKSTTAYAGSTTSEPKSVNISRLTEAKKNGIYLSMYCEAAKDDWTGATATLEAQCVNVIAK